ncbi:aminotransferase, class V family protein [Trichomonas vaginalis G3]|uniref:phosphoserine transaminase n=1 Tax=Trichomonas vaginalis (strain ATCC PRA-98 / G3) TaxID=412133 RepID=A2D968_TRIV3|nr:Chain A Aminotransferase Class V Family Protein [Trichomonas vaginalis G3]EAY23094.1 aminotransferase, class V family protein [Trichomonas vaginalis G3]KAI5513850.1 Chain A Aminotransferase Class V Family Protein [Trichomonas vaginalis G3]|eukprot:XP_001584080.1 aminotransferase, class V family protein [Trichomonas vaginalis G3]
MSSGRVYNFSAGPAAVPLECLERAAAEMTNWRNSGMSVIEVSHRGKHWMEEQKEAGERLRSLLQVPENFHILFVAGGSSLQFSAIPFNFIGDHKRVDYLCTGTWSKKAFDEAKRLGFPGVEVRSVAGNPPANPIEVPARDTWDVSADAAYFYYCDNETIQGIEFPSFPDVPAPLVIDMSSNFLSRPITQWEKVGCIFACAQKNFGLSGMSVVIIRKDMLERPVKPFCPITMDYRIQVKNDCMYNTPPTFAIYFANHVFKWIEEKGGVAAMDAFSKEKAKKVYEAIDSNPNFVNRIKPEWRSRMNMPFFRPDGYENKNIEADLKFVNFCTQRKLLTLKGHQSVGGFRASCYNACPMEAVDALVQAMKEWPGF